MKTAMTRKLIGRLRAKMTEIQSINVRGHKDHQVVDVSGDEDYRQTYPTVSLGPDGKLVVHSKVAEHWQKDALLLDWM